MSATITAETKISAPRKGRLRAQFRAFWGKVRGVVRRFGQFLSRSARSTGSVIRRGARQGVSWGRSGLLGLRRGIAWTGTTLWSGARFLGRYALRGVGYLGALLAGAVSLAVDGFAWVASLGMTWIFIGVMAILVGIAMLSLYWDQFVVGTFKWISKKDRPNYRRYIRSRKPLAEGEIPLYVDPDDPQYPPTPFDFPVTPEEADQLEATWNTDPTSTSPGVVGSDFKLSRREEAVLQNGQLDMAARLMKWFEGQGILLNYSIDENGVITFGKSGITDKVFDMELNQWLADASVDLVHEALMSMLESATDPKHRAYLAGRLRTLQTVDETPELIKDQRKFWAQIHQEFKPRQADYPINTVRKGFNDMFEEIKDSSLVAGI